MKNPTLRALSFVIAASFLASPLSAPAQESAGGKGSIFYRLGKSIKASLIQPTRRPARKVRLKSALREQHAQNVDQFQSEPHSRHTELSSNVLALHFSFGEPGVRAGHSLDEDASE
ncbi:MAG: hypothetical protein ACC661_09255 [Verrucomicrobiales bacterium]